jgi:Family of unknown function (DUF6518)
VRSHRLVLLTLVAALALGVGGRVLVRVGWELPRGEDLATAGSTAKALGAPWLAAAWGLGSLAGSRLRGALAGAAALVLGTVCWYFVSLAIHGPPAVGYVVPVSIGWSVVAGAAGAAFGLIGALWRDGDTPARAASIALLAGALAGEAVLLLGKWSGQATSLVLGLELLAATTALMLSRRRAPIILTLSLFLVAAMAMAGAEDAARDTVRLVGWRGP